ncbi:MAG: polysaccharide deacetylase family protein [Clostridia bacterium]
MKTTGVIYLTFDDGPSDITPEVLDILQENEIKATFFIVDYSEEDKSKIQRIIDEGHTLGLHGLSHDYAKIYSSVDAITENFIGLQKKILNDFDYNAIYIRFPGGASNTISKKYCDGVMTAATSKVEQEGFTYYDWNVDVNDAGSARTANKVYDNFVAGIVPQRENVVLMHDGYGHQPTADALQKIIDYAKENGYVFSEITEDTIPVQHGVNN